MLIASLATPLKGAVSILYAKTLISSGLLQLPLNPVDKTHPNPACECLTTDSTSSCRVHKSIGADRTYNSDLL
jgi:hypothetical protein